MNSPSLSPSLSLSKSDEIELLGATIAGLPDGYLRDILTESRGAIVSAIRNDLGFAGIGEMIAMRAQCLSETKQALVDCESKLAARTETVRNLEREIAYGSRQLREVRDVLQTVARDTSSVSATVFQACCKLATGGVA